MKKNMLDAIREVSPSACEELEKSGMNYFQLQNYVNAHNAKVRGEVAPASIGAPVPQIIPGQLSQHPGQ